MNAAIFSENYKRTNDHDLMRLANSIDNENIREHAKKLQRVVKDEDSLRYPSSWPFPEIPHDRYGELEAIEAVDLAKQILEEISEHFDVL